MKQETFSAHDDDKSLSYSDKSHPKLYLNFNTALWQTTLPPASYKNIWIINLKSLEGNIEELCQGSYI